MTVGEKIKTFRTIRGISQNVLGELAGIDGTTIRKYELGSRKPKPDQLLKIANALGVSINVFTDFDIELEQMNETCEQIKQHLVDTNRIVKKGTSGISVRIYPENT